MSGVSIETLERDYFQFCLSHNRPYLGTVLRAGQGDKRRHFWMQKLIELEARQRAGQALRVLEIGSWAGGSAITWANALKAYNAGRGTIVCVDPWEPFFDPEQVLFDMDGRQDLQALYEDMAQALTSGDIVRLFDHNIRAAGHDDIIAVVRGSSDDVLPHLRQEQRQFDVIFVDGRHAYAPVLADLQGAAAILADGGVLCGDDLEAQLPEVDVAHAYACEDLDYVADPVSGVLFHPGVTLAVAEFFGDVSVYTGFWLMRRQGGTWVQVSLAERPV